MTTLERLKNKADVFGKNAKMPSIMQISKMLTEFGVEHDVSTHTNIVEYRSAGCRYVNSRHAGKTGKVLKIFNPQIELDTSDSYYSWNTSGYAREIIEFLKKEGKI